MDDEKLGFTSSIIDIVGKIFEYFIGPILGATAIYFNNNCIWYIIEAIGFIILMVFFIQRKELKNRKLKRKIGKLNRNLAIRRVNLYHKMKNRFNKNQDIDTLEDIVMPGLKEYVNSISKILQKYTKEESIVVSIRIFKEKQQDLQDSVLDVLSYSDNANEKKDKYFKDRKKEYKMIKNNTDFNLIIGMETGNDKPMVQFDYIYASDINKFDEYLNKEYNIRYRGQIFEGDKVYKSRIVVPITIEPEYNYSQNNSDEDFNIIAFLCADCMKKNVFPKNKNEKWFYLSLMQTYASDLYAILNKYNKYMEIIKGGQVNGNI